MVMPWELLLQREPSSSKPAQEIISVQLMQTRPGEEGMLKVTAEIRRAVTWAPGMPKVASEKKDDKKENHLCGFVLLPIIFLVGV